MSSLLDGRSSRFRPLSNRVSYGYGYGYGVDRETSTKLLFPAPPALLVKCSWKTFCSRSEFRVFLGFFLDMGFGVRSYATAMRSLHSLLLPPLASSLRTSGVARGLLVDWKFSNDTGSPLGFWKHALLFPGRSVSSNADTSAGKLLKYKEWFSGHFNVSSWLCCLSNSSLMLFLVCLKWRSHWLLVVEIGHHGCGSPCN